VEAVIGPSPGVGESQPGTRKPCVIQEPINPFAKPALVVNGVINLYGVKKARQIIQTTEGGKASGVQNPLAPLRIVLIARSDGAFRHRFRPITGDLAAKPWNN